MMRATGLILLVGAMAFGCVGVDDAEDSGNQVSGDGKFDDFRDDGTTFFVHDNGRVCFAAPCPSYTVITPGGARFDVARVEVEPEAEAATALLATGGVLVAGSLEDGSWNPGQEGPALHVARAIEPAKAYLVHRHAGAAGAPYAVVTPEAIDHHVDRVDLAGYVPADLDVDQSLATLVTGQWATRGFFAHGDTGERVLYATRGTGASVSFVARASGIECVSEPCPVWSLESMEGAQMGNASRLDLGWTHLAAEEQEEIVDRLYAEGGAVYGWLAEGSWESPGRGDVLLVVSVLDGMAH